MEEFQLWMKPYTMLPSLSAHLQVKNIYLTDKVVQTNTRISLLSLPNLCVTSKKVFYEWQDS
jgi:hypothetical protein